MQQPHQEVIYMQQPAQTTAYQVQKPDLTSHVRTRSEYIAPPAPQPRQSIV